MPTPNRRPLEAPPYPLDEVVDDWARSLALHRSQRTIDSYLWVAKNFSTFLASRDAPQDVTLLEDRHVQDFLIDCKTRMKINSVGVHYRSLQQLFRYLDENDNLPNGNPMARMKPPKPEVPDIDFPRDGELRALLAACGGRDFEAKRDLALVRFFCDTGCRVGEVVGMEVENYRKESFSVRVVGKGNRPRTVSMGDVTAKSLNDYLRFRAVHPEASNTERFWVGRKGPLTASGISQLLTRRCRQAGIRRVHPHQFRHLWASNWHESGHSESELMVAAGWSSREMAARYGRATAAERAASTQRRISVIDRMMAK